MVLIFFNFKNITFQIVPTWATLSSNVQQSLVEDNELFLDLRDITALSLGNIVHFQK